MMTLSNGRSTRCIRCDARLGGLLGAFRARGISCPDETCDTDICVNCLPELAEWREQGFGPLRRGVLEITCPTCGALIHRTDFPSELEQSAKHAVQLGRKKARELIMRMGLESIKGRVRRS